MTLLNQIVAIHKGVQQTAKNAMTEADKRYQRSDGPLKGIVKTYEPIDVAGLVYPPEETRVQELVQDTLDDCADLLARMFDVTATKDEANTRARADVVVDGKVIVAQAPVPFLLTLEQQLVDWRTFVSRLPALDLAEDWEFDPNANAYRTAARSNVKSVKVPRVLVKYQATEQHPAQTEVYSADVPEGTWTRIEFSGKLPAARIALLVATADKLLAAVKEARELANTLEVTDVKPGAAIMRYLMLETV